MNYHPITRRESIKKLFKICGGLALADALTWPFQKTISAWAGSTHKKFIVEGIGRNHEYSVKALVGKVFEAAGGIHTFVSKQDVVVIKPNISWARSPDLAATTHPEVLEAVVELCQEAGAKKIRIADHTIHDARRCFAITGAGMVAKKTGADLVYPRSSLMRNMKLQGHRLDVWPVFLPLVEADKVINLPVAKVHSLSGLTLGMKNWIGAVGGRRSALHQDIHLTIVDLAQFFNPTITLIDATRIMVSNGPSGGSRSDVAVSNRLILSDDPVAADAKASGLFNFRPKDIGFIRLGEKWGLGTTEFQKLRQHKVII
ncbi:MAG: DUF362 domain-containing protein [Deltaproteobacteria bacterium]|nr:DUF362 domain-containing protein [Deltaproteobacteria bacterium]MBW2013109.1 DUF362 domain-containing protein [Deltaproteobacteria bacterium]MBW2089448.1 DUF362 domain-containing protein [Deltaproteobacteria bacterium]MBW2319476.1 DUF362 domain-containing protein [Deltaproteobacteria bacterium]